MLTVEDSNFDFRNIPLDFCIKGNAMDAALTLKLYYLLQAELDKHPAKNLVENVLMPAVAEFAPIEYDGMDVDVNELKNVERVLSSNLINIEDEMFSLDFIKGEDNLKSSKDLTEIFYTREGGFELYPPDRTEKGAPSTDQDTLKILLTQINQELINRGEMG